MNVYPYWIQRADFSSREHASVSVGDAVRAFENHDWRGEFRLYTEFEVAGKECCPPGIGFVAPNGGILHVCPDENGTALIHYHFAASRKLLGFIPRTTVTTVTRGDVARSSIVDLIRLFFDGQHAFLVERLGAGAGPPIA